MFDVCPADWRLLLLDGNSEAVVGHCWGRFSLQARPFKHPWMRKRWESSARMLTCSDVRFMSHLTCAMRVPASAIPTGCHARQASASDSQTPNVASRKAVQPMRARGLVCQQNETPPETAHPPPTRPCAESCLLPCVSPSPSSTLGMNTGYAGDFCARLVFHRHAQLGSHG